MKKVSEIRKELKDLGYKLRLEYTNFSGLGYGSCYIPNYIDLKDNEEYSFNHNSIYSKNTLEEHKELLIYIKSTLRNLNQVYYRELKIIF